MKKGEVNTEWHAAHIMPASPTREERIEWHAEHAEACGCREVPKSLAAEVMALRKRKPGRAN